jgi:hypothetical protein
VPDLDSIRRVMGGWHLWEVADGALRPLLAGVAPSPACEQLWGRLEARQPWRFEFLLDRLSTDEEWVYKRDARVRLPSATTSGRASPGPVSPPGSPVRRISTLAQPIN